MTKAIYILSSLALGFCSMLNAQVGINTSTPTEVVDINGTARVRSLPAIGTANSIYTTGTNTQSGTTPTQTFNGTTLVVADNNGVMGRSTATNSTLVPNNTTSGFNTTNTSSAMFVIRRYNIGDWPSGAGGVSLGMDLARWEAILSNVQYNIPQAASSTNGVFTNEHGYRLRANAGGVWTIIGDINGITDSAIIDVLFINKNYTAQDVRTN